MTRCQLIRVSHATAMLRLHPAGLVLHSGLTIERLWLEQISNRVVHARWLSIHLDIGNRAAIVNGAVGWCRHVDFRTITLPVKGPGLIAVMTAVITAEGA